MLRDVRASVLMKGSMGREFSCKVGLRQGSKSSPKLATLLLDEITSLLSNCRGGLVLFDTTVNHIFYADDLVLLFERHEEATDALFKMKFLCESFGLSVSVEKSFTVYFTASNRARNRSNTLKWGNQSLPTHSCAKYLGCTLSHNLKFQSHILLVEQKANRSFALLMNFQKRFPLLKFSQFIRIYFTLVFTVYASSTAVFAWTEGDKLNSIFTEHLRRYFNLPKRTCRNAILYLAGIPPIQTKVYRSGYNFWLSLTKMDESRFEKMCYRTMKCSEKKNWFNDMCTVFRQIGFEGDYKYWGSSCVSEQKHTFSDTLESYFSSSIQKSIDESGYTFLREYCMTFGLPAHFLDVASFWNRRVLARFVLKGYKFESVTGAWHNLIRKERFCQYCWKNCGTISLGNEKHYLEKCPRFQIEREKIGYPASDLISILFNKRPTSVTTLHQYHALAKFIKVSFDQLSDPFLDTT